MACLPISIVLYPFCLMSCPRASFAMLDVTLAPRYLQRTLYMAFPGRFSVFSCVVYDFCIWSTRFLSPVLL